MVTLIKNHQKELGTLCRDYNVRRLEIFGSAASGEGFDITTSDIDFLVEFLPMSPVEHSKSYFGLLEALQDMFARPIDLVEIKAVSNPYLIESINKSRSQIYAA